MANVRSKCHTLSAMVSLIDLLVEVVIVTSAVEGATANPLDMVCAVHRIPYSALQPSFPCS